MQNLKWVIERAWWHFGVHRLRCLDGEYPLQMIEFILKRVFIFFSIWPDLHPRHQYNFNLFWLPLALNEIFVQVSDELDRAFVQDVNRNFTNEILKKFCIYYYKIIWKYNTMSTKTQQVPWQIHVNNWYSKSIDYLKKSNHFLWAVRIWLYFYVSIDCYLE